MIRFAKIALLAMYLCLLVVIVAGCQDRYRYPCQNPDNFYKPECQKPKCLFTQMCPEYLVAPILEKQISGQQQQPQQAEQSPNR